MIIAIEGQDGSGKSTVIEHLKKRFRGAYFIQFPETPKQYIESIDILEPFVFSLFEQMYEPRSVYITDRFFSVSSRVYSRFRDEYNTFSENELDAWVLPDLNIIHLDQHPRFIPNRLSEVDKTPNELETAMRLHECYKAVLKELSPASLNVVNTEGGISKTVHHVIRIVEGLIEHHVHRQENS